MWQKLDRFLGQKCCVFCGRSPVESSPAVQVELVPPNAQKTVANGVLPPANGHVPNGLVPATRSPAQPGPLGVGPGGYQETRVQLTATYQPAAPSAGFFSKPGQNGGVQSSAADFSRPAHSQPSAQHQNGYQQREAPRPPVSWASPDPTRPTPGHVSLRHPYQPSPSRHPYPASSAAGPAGGPAGQQAAPVTSRADGAGGSRAALQWGAKVPPPAYSLPRQQQRPAEEAPPTAATLPAGPGHDRSRPGEPPPPGAGLTAGEPVFISDLKAGDLLGRSNEELVLLLIQLRRQAAAAAAARDRVSRQLDRAVAEAGGNGRQTEQTERLRAQMVRLDTQHQLTRPLITLVDNMLKLSSLRGSRGAGGGGGAGGPPPPTGDPSEPQPPPAILAPPSGQSGDSQERPPAAGDEEPVRDSERLLQRQRALQDELSRVKAVLSSSAKTLDETAADNSRLEREMLSLRQRLQAALKATNHSSSSYNHEVRTLEAEVRRVQRMLSSRQSERRGPAAEESRRSVRRAPDDHRQSNGEPAPLHRAGSARLATSYDAEYDEQSLMSPPLDRHAPPPPAPLGGQFRQQADRRHHMSNGAVRGGPSAQSSSPPDSGGQGRQQRTGSRRGLPKSVSGPLSGDYDSLYDSPYDAAYDRAAYDPPPYVPPAPPPADTDQRRGADWPGHAGGAAWPPGRHDWRRDGGRGSVRHHAGSQQDVRSALTASQQDMRSALTTSQQDVRTALAASYQAYRRASGALADGDGDRRLQAVLRQYRSQQDLGSAGDPAARYGGYRQTRGLPYGQEMNGGYYQGPSSRQGYVQEHRRSYSQLHDRDVPVHERRQSVHHFSESRERDRSLPQTHEPRQRDRSLPQTHEPRERDQSLPRNYEPRERDVSLPRNHEPRERDQSLPRSYEPHQSLPRTYDPRVPDQNQPRTQEPPQPIGRTLESGGDAVVTQPSPLRVSGGPGGRAAPDRVDTSRAALVHRQGGAFQPYQADHGSSHDYRRDPGSGGDPVYSAVQRSYSNGAGEARDGAREQAARHDRPQQQQQQPQRTAADSNMHRQTAGDAVSGRPRSPAAPVDRQSAARERRRDHGPAVNGSGPHGDATVTSLHSHPLHPAGQRTAPTNGSQDRSPPAGDSLDTTTAGGVAHTATQHAQQAAQQPPSQWTGGQVVELAAEETRPAPTGAESQLPGGAQMPPGGEAGPAAGGAAELAGGEVDTRSVGTVGQRVAVWEGKDHDSTAAEANSSSGGPQRMETDGGQERTAAEPAETYQSHETMGPLYALLARDRGSLEIKTVRTVKRESQQRQREKTRQWSAEEDLAAGDDVTSDPEPEEEEEEDPLVTDPVLSQFQRAMSLPRGYGGRRASEQDTSQYRHHVLKRLVDKRRPADRRPSAYERLFGSTPELRAAAVPAAERQDRSLRRVPRRHNTVSGGGRLAVRRLSDAHGASTEELSSGSRPALRQASSTPDIVRASRPGLGTKYDEDTIDKLLARPQKIRIPERYVPELEVEPMSVEERLQRSRKAASIRKMLTQSTGFLDSIGSATAEPRVRPGAAATDKLQRAHILQLNEILARQVTEQSKRVAVEAIANMEAPPPEAPAESPPPEPMPLVQQRESCLT